MAQNLNSSGFFTTEPAAPVGRRIVKRSYLNNVENYGNGQAQVPIHGPLNLPNAGRAVQCGFGLPIARAPLTETGPFFRQANVPSTTAPFDEDITYPDNPVFVLIRAREKRNIDIAQCTNKWVFSPQTEKRVIRMAGEEKDIYLVFYVKDLQMFMGVAAYKGMNLGVQFSKPTASIQWIFRSVVKRSKTSHLFNPYNNGKPIHEAQDGTVIRSDVGEELMRIYASFEVSKIN